MAESENEAGEAPDATDQAIAASRTAGLKVMGVLAPAPLQAPFPPLSTVAETWANEVIRAVSRYRGQVDAWEVACDPVRFALDVCASLLEVACKAIRLTDPEGTVLFDGGILEPDSLERIFARNGKLYFDIFSARWDDSRPEGRLRQDIARLLDIMGRYRGPKPVWITLSSPSPEKIIRHFCQAQAAGVQKILLDQEILLAPSPDMVDACRRLIMPKLWKARYVGPIWLGQEAEGFVFNQSGRPVMVAWSSKPLPVSLRIGATEGSWSGLSADSQPLSTPEGMASLKLTASPILLEGASPDTLFSQAMLTVPALPLMVSPKGSSKLLVRLYSPGPRSGVMVAPVLPEGWKSIPRQQVVSLLADRPRQLAFTVLPPKSLSYTITTIPVKAWLPGLPLPPAFQEAGVQLISSEKNATLSP